MAEALWILFVFTLGLGIGVAALGGFAWREVRKRAVAEHLAIQIARQYDQLVAVVAEGRGRPTAEEWPEELKEV